MHFILNIIIAIVWLVNGLVCKILNLVPRHQKIAARILGSQYAYLLTKIIGALEVLIAVWILSGIQPETSMIFQIIVIILMNVIELIYAKDLLLFGKINIVFALLLCCLIYANEFLL